ncbi:MAG: histidine phosphatase family protein [Micrococcales bacterium]|nr:histidine phosphatase family protein [Micrococcales bacterium]
MRLALVRHGQTDLNLQGRLQGSSDWPLNETGLAQARQAVEEVRDTAAPWDLVVSSPRQRARRTAEIIADGLGIELGPTYELLLERDYGALEGAEEAEVERLWPGKSEPSVETLDSVVHRGLRALGELRNAWTGRRVVAVCHGTIIRYTLSEIAGRKLPQPGNATASMVEWTGGAWRVLTVGGAPV